MTSIQNSGEKFVLNLGEQPMSANDSHHNMFSGANLQTSVQTEQTKPQEVELGIGTETP